MKFLPIIAKKLLNVWWNNHYLFASESCWNILQEYPKECIRTRIFFQFTTKIHIFCKCFNEIVCCTFSQWPPHVSLALVWMHANIARNGSRSTSRKPGRIIYALVVCCWSLRVDAIWCSYCNFSMTSFTINTWSWPSTLVIIPWQNRLANFYWYLQSTPTITDLAITDYHL